MSRTVQESSDYNVTPIRPQVASGGGGSHDGDVRERVAKLEARMDSIIPTLATREDMHKIDASIKAWMIATIIGLFFGFAGLFFAMSNSINAQIGGVKSSIAPSAAPASSIQKPNG